MSAPLEEAWLEESLCQPVVEEHQGAKSTKGGHQNKGKTIWGGLGYHGLDSGKREGAGLPGREKVSETHLTLFLGTENAGKLIAKCSCVMARFSCPDLTTKCSSGNAAISQFA